MVGEPEDQRWGSFSPDGQHFVHLEAGPQSSAIVVRSWPEADRPQTLATGDVSRPVWSPRGDEIFFFSSDGVMVVDVGSTSAMEFGDARLLLPGSFDNTTLGVTPDAQHLLLVRGEKGDPVTDIRVVSNWLSEVERLVPAR